MQNLSFIRLSLHSFGGLRIPVRVSVLLSVCVSVLLSLYCAATADADPTVPEELTERASLNRPGARPDPEGTPTRVAVTVYLLDISYIDDVRQSFSADFVLQLRWHDRRNSLPHTVRRFRSRLYGAGILRLRRRSRHEPASQTRTRAHCPQDRSLDAVDLPTRLRGHYVSHLVKLTRGPLHIVGVGARKCLKPAHREEPAARDRTSEPASRSRVLPYNTTRSAACACTSSTGAPV